MILLRLAMVENMQGIRKMPASGHDDCNSSSKGRLPRIVILASTLLHLGFPATPHGNGAANALARAEDVIDSARIELPQMAPLRHADCIGQCPLSGVTRKSFAHTEFFSV
jgi:hypothetical protein